MSNITQFDSDNLADIIWWIKGYMAAKKLNDDDFDSPFCADHVNSLKKYRLAIKIEDNGN